jgi:hypothetical protein
MESFPDEGKAKLAVMVAPKFDKAAITNLNIDQAINRWIVGFHAALYREYPVGFRGNIVSPFPRYDVIDGKYVLADYLLQTAAFVDAIKNYRARNNLDSIRANKGAMTYECIWDQSDNKKVWMCIFALDIYGWKDLGKTDLAPARGCSGFYTVTANTPPEFATKGIKYKIQIPNYDPLDAFSK